MVFFVNVHSHTKSFRIPSNMLVESYIFNFEGDIISLTTFPGFSPVVSDESNLTLLI
jgi:hypothetical protein